MIRKITDKRHSPFPSPCPPVGTTRIGGLGLLGSGELLYNSMELQTRTGQAEKNASHGSSIVQLVHSETRYCRIMCSHVGSDSHTRK